MSFFEISAHPHHHTDRVRSALSQLDSLLRSMALCSVDQDDPRVSRFTNRTVPAVSAPPSHVQSLPPQWEPHHQHTHHPTYPHHLQHPQTLPSTPYVTPNPPSPSSCCCANFTLGHNSNTAKEWTPLWLTTPTWQDSWPEADIRKEECRRIVWSSMMLTAGHSSYTVAWGGSAQLDLFINNPANVSFRVLEASLRLCSLYVNLSLTFPQVHGTLPRRILDACGLLRLSKRDRMGVVHACHAALA